MSKDMQRTLFPRKVFYFLATQTKKKHLLKLGIHGSPDKRELRKIMGKIRYYYFQNIENSSGLIIQHFNGRPFESIFRFYHFIIFARFTQNRKEIHENFQCDLYLFKFYSICQRQYKYNFLYRTLHRFVQDATNSTSAVHRGTKALERLLGWI